MRALQQILAASRIAPTADTGAQLTAVLARPDPAKIIDTNHPVDAVTFSPDGKRIVSAGSDRTVRVWDAARPTPRPAAHRCEILRSSVIHKLVSQKRNRLRHPSAPSAPCAATSKLLAPPAASNVASGMTVRHRAAAACSSTAGADGDVTGRNPSIRLSRKRWVDATETPPCQHARFQAQRLDRLS